MESRALMGPEGNRAHSGAHSLLGPGRRNRSSTSLKVQGLCPNFTAGKRNPQQRQHNLSCRRSSPSVRSIGTTLFSWSKRVRRSFAGMFGAICNPKHVLENDQRLLCAYCVVAGCYAPGEQPICHSDLCMSSRLGQKLRKGVVSPCTMCS